MEGRGMEGRGMEGRGMGGRGMGGRGMEGRGMEGRGMEAKRIGARGDFADDHPSQHKVMPSCWQLGAFQFQTLNQICLPTSGLMGFDRRIPPPLQWREYYNSINAL
jgi:hypothetical protein